MLGIQFVQVDIFNQCALHIVQAHSHQFDLAGIIHKIMNHSACDISNAVEVGLHQLDLGAGFFDLDGKVGHLLVIKEPSAHCHAMRQFPFQYLEFFTQQIKHWICTLRLILHLSESGPGTFRSSSNRFACCAHVFLLCSYASGLFFCLVKNVPVSVQFVGNLPDDVFSAESCVLGYGPDRFFECIRSERSAQSVAKFASAPDNSPDARYFMHPLAYFRPCFLIVFGIRNDCIYRITNCSRCGIRLVEIVNHPDGLYADRFQILDRFRKPCVHVLIWICNSSFRRDRPTFRKTAVTTHERPCHPHLVPHIEHASKRFFHPTELERCLLNKLVNFLNVFAKPVKLLVDAGNVALDMIEAGVESTPHIPNLVVRVPDLFRYTGNLVCRPDIDIDIAQTLKLVHCVGKVFQRGNCFGRNILVNGPRNVPDLGSRAAEIYSASDSVQPVQGFGKPAQPFKRSSAEIGVHGVSDLFDVRTDAAHSDSVANYIF